jgi:hypothetical protein
MMDRERAEQLAARRNARLRAKYPLFADQLPEETAERMQREYNPTPAHHGLRAPRARIGCLALRPKCG